MSSELTGRSYRIGEVVFIYYDGQVPTPRIGQIIRLDNGQLAEVLTAKCSDGSVEARKLTARVVGVER